jgi:hypothetical protein
MPELFYLQRNVLSESEIESLLDYVTLSTDAEEDYRPFYEHKGISIQDFYSSTDPEVESLRRVIIECYKTFTKNYEFNFNRFELKRLFGNVMNKGAVNEAHDDDGDIYPGKPDAEEHYSAILMLSSEYGGGELYFEHHDVEVKLNAGDLIMFRGNAENLHGVREVTSGIRVNVVIFFRNYHQEHPIDGDEWLSFVERYASS